MARLLIYVGQVSINFFYFLLMVQLVSFCFNCHISRIHPWLVENKDGDAEIRSSNTCL